MSFLSIRNNMSGQISGALLFADSKGYLFDEAGFDDVKLRFIRQIKAQQKSLR